MSSSYKHKLSRGLLAAAALSYCSQLIWFGSKCFHQIDIDGMDYVGIARHLRNHQFYSAINDFRSPLLSWMIAAGSLFDGDLARVGKVLTIGSYLLCGPLLYVFTKSLWHSELAGSAAVFWFSLCRGLSTIAVAMVTPDFLFAALVLVYFIMLLQCFRTDEKRWWGVLGGIHALAFLAKAFALPWLGLTTIFSILFYGHRKSTPLKRQAACLVLAAIPPLLVATAWAGVLHLKYDAFTSGTQFKVNFLQWSTHAYDQQPDRTYAVLEDTKPFMDEYHVDDPMPPGSWLWHYRIDARQAVAELAAHEAHNLPKAAKELLIVVTPGGVAAFLFVIALQIRRREQNPIEFTIAAMVGWACVSLLLAYCMLVFDGRYLYPIIPLLLAVAVGFLEPMGPALRMWRTGILALIVVGIFVSLVYSSSPFRTIRRDFQISCYRAGQSLRAHPGSTVVSVGSGPYQEHGVGWEAGYKSAYFGDRILIAAANQLPDVKETPALLRDLSKASPDAILVWGKPGEIRYDALVQLLIREYAGSSRDALVDPLLGEVGSALYVRRR